MGLLLICRSLYLIEISFKFMLLDELGKLGLTDKEARVFIAGLELGADTAQNIAEKSGINRATTYVQIESLKEKGLMSSFEKGKKTYFASESPEALKLLFRKEERQLEDKKMGFEKLLPEMMAMYANKGERPRVRFFEGFAGLEAIREDFLGTKSEQVEAIFNYDKLGLLFTGRQQDHVRSRVNRGIKSRALYTRAEGPLETLNDKTLLREAKHIVLEGYEVTADITAYDDKLSIITYKQNPIGVLIESPEITQTFRMLFYLIWNSK